MIGLAINFRGYECPEHLELRLDEQGLKLFKTDEAKLGPVWVDLAGGAANHRRLYGGGKGQSIAKAVGVKAGKFPRVLDATAGLGRDSFVLASLGCPVVMLERHPVVAALLFDGLERAKQSDEIGHWLQERMQLVPQQPLTTLTTDELPWTPEVIYLDPMYPHRQKSALVKKEMRVFQTLVGDDQDADALLPAALQLATQRVVVKRPDYAPPLNNTQPTMTIDTKKNRFDVYVIAAMNPR